ncbi:MAG TPA: Uma2 family endonuclease [Blastocatellia bacterium]|jgi:Uma2 family endonuclease|nr:Uma2 family endonuclease [Blastocatellia bacterium]
MASTLRWTSADLDALPDDGKRYEIIDGELLVSKQPHLYHQDVCYRAASLLNAWSEPAGLGRAFVNPGLIFADDDDVVPDVVWISTSRLAVSLMDDGKLHSAPELVIEVLSPGASNLRRDREAKLKLYSRRGVSEYWLADWFTRTLEIFRGENDALRLDATLSGDDAIESSILPGFSAGVADLFVGLPEP